MNTISQEEEMACSFCGAPFTFVGRGIGWECLTEGCRESPRSLVEVANTDRRHQASTLIDAGSNPAGDATSAYRVCVVHPMTNQDCVPCLRERVDRLTAERYAYKAALDNAHKVFTADCEGLGRTIAKQASDFGRLTAALTVIADNCDWHRWCNVAREALGRPTVGQLPSETPEQICERGFKSYLDSAAALVAALKDSP